MSLTTDPNDPKLKRGIDTEITGQNEVYLVLSEEKRGQGFIRPVRNSYVHVGNKVERDDEGGIVGRLIQIDDSEYPQNEHFTQEKGYGGYIKYPKDHKSGSVGKYIIIKEVEAIVNRQRHFGGCGVRTTMNNVISETYARNPKFYGATYCCGCDKHLRVSEFVWDGTEEEVGS